MCRAQSALPRPAPDEPNSLRRHHRRSRRHSAAHAATQVRSDAPLAAVRRPRPAPHATAVLALMTPRISGVGAWLPTLTLAKWPPQTTSATPGSQPTRLSSVCTLPGGAAPGEGAPPGGGGGAALAGSVTICRVVVPEPVSSAVWPAASSAGAPPGFNSMLRGRESSAAMAAKLKAMTEKLTNARSLLWPGTRQ
jgi:hypothetical protein